MKSISVYKLNFRRPVEVKVECDGFGSHQKHYLIFLSLVELSSSLSTLSVFGFSSIKLFLKTANGEYNTLVEL